MILGLLLLACGQAAEDPPGTTRCAVDQPALTESSGLARSGTADAFWTHNDSGSRAVIFEVGADCTMGKEVVLHGKVATDWEEISSFVAGTHRWLVVADTGDNFKRRTSLALHLFKEPTESGIVVVDRTLEFRYPDGPHDTEGVIADPTSKQFLLITKDRGEGTLVFTLPMQPAQIRVQVAKPLATLTLAPEGDLSGRRVTAADLSEDGTTLALLTYTDAWTYTREPGQDWKQTFASTPTRSEIPVLPQGEGISLSADGTALFFTSEGSPMPLVRVPR